MLIACDSNTEIAKSSKDDWQNKSIKYFWPKNFTSQYTDHGLKFASVTRQLYSTQTNACVQDCGLIVCPSEPWLAYAPDGVIIKYSRLFGLLEMKCPCNLPDIDIRSLQAKCKRFLCFNKQNVFLKNPNAYLHSVTSQLACLQLFFL
ncbi:hypothetical protein PV327_010165 [Microctonus hyperodae]|uniref:YqaJ viral recombinase domain-containing protein n=1 Tax=Microctonus hyperodae TaxID=165561 RepID=A0AA39FRN2_MICHY|nr:hypothetical protein PV327_010165 [Microctonus hyperodae]